MTGITFLNSKIVTLNLPISITRGELLGAKFWEPLLCMYSSFNFDRKTCVKFKCEVMSLITLVFTVKDYQLHFKAVHKTFKKLLLSL